MSHFRLHDDIFSPVRCDSSTVDESNISLEGSSNDLLNFDELSLTEEFKDKISLAKSIINSPLDYELNPKNGNVKNVQSTNTSKLVLSKNLSDKSSVNKNSSRSKLEEVKGRKGNAIRKENIEAHLKEQRSVCSENFTDSSCPKSDNSSKLHKKKVKSTSSLLKNETAKQDLLKNIQKGNNQSSNHGSVNKEQKSSSKLLMEGNKTGSSSASLENNDGKLNYPSVMLTEIKKNTSKTHMNEEKSNSNSISLQAEELNSNPLHTSYEASIKQMIRNSISTESAKVRQLMYMQQMSFYREMNKIKDNMEKHHLEVTEHLFKVIEELMQMNVTLRTRLLNKI